MEDLTLASGVYRIGKFPSAVAQLQVARRLAPVFVKLAPLVEGLEKLFPDGTSGDPVTAAFDFSALMKDVEPFAEALSDMPDEKFTYIINACLGVVYRQSGAGGGFAPVMANGVQMFSDITASDTMRIVFAVVSENLRNFMNGPPSASSR